MSRVATLALLFLLGCDGPRQLAVQVLVPDLRGVATPLPGVEVAALPYDRDSVLRALESRAPTGRPHTRELDSLFQAFREPFLAFARAAWDVEQARRLRDSLAARRGAASPGTPGARELDLMLQHAEDSLRRLTPRLEGARSALSAARDTLWPRIEQLQAEVRRWELSAYAGYDTIVRGFARDRLKLGIADTTDTGGWASLSLNSGRWWIYARSPDPRDPNAQWYWNVPATGDTLRLNPATGRHLPRY
jgi:hypothetical protein